MCVALPARVEQLRPGSRAVVALPSGSREVSVQCVPDIAVGDYVLVNLGIATTRLSAEEASEVVQLWEEVGGAVSGITEPGGDENV